MDSKRVELETGGWAEVRRLTPGDVRFVRGIVRERGFEDAELDALALMPRVITSWSLGEITDDTIDNDLTEMDYLRIWAVAKGADIPSPLAGSSNGSTPKASKRTKGRSSG